MRSTMVREHTVSMSNGDVVVAAPYERHDIADVTDTVDWFNRLRPSWMQPLTMTTVSTRAIAWMR